MADVCYLFIALLTACGGSTTENNSGSDTSLQTTGAAITIDNAGVIPVFANHVTSTIIHVHNNTSSTISGINYNLDNEDSNNRAVSMIVNVSLLLLVKAVRLRLLHPNYLHNKPKAQCQLELAIISQINPIHLAN